MTVLGPIPPEQLGLTLIHEHLLVDFRGAGLPSYGTWDRTAVREAVRPFVEAAMARGVRSMLDCTPNYLGRDVRLLKEISEETGLQLLTNTGYYGAVNNKYLPAWTFTESAAQLARRWIREYEEGIDGTGIRPGFIKIGVNPGPLSAVHQKLIRAAGLTHLATGLTICSHTGPAQGAMEQIKILKELGVSPGAFVWVHAQNELDKSQYRKAARDGAWVSLDGMGWGKEKQYAEWLATLKAQGNLSKVLVSHDAGCYRPGEADPMAKFAGYTALFDTVRPLLEKKGFVEKDFDQLLLDNPARAFTLSVRKL